MDTGKFIGLLVFGIVGVLVVMAFIPMITETTSATDTFTNSGSYYLTDDDDSYTLVYDPSGKFIVNGEDIPFTDLPAYGRMSVGTTDEFMLRFVNDATSKYDFRLIDFSSPLSIASSDSVAPVTLTFNNGTLSISGSETTYTYTSESFRGLAKEGNYVMTNGTDKPKVNSDTTIILGDGTTQVAHWYDRFYMIGTVEDMDVSASEGITISDTEVNATKISGYVDLVEFTSITFTATDGNTTADATYNRVIVPVTVTTEKAIHPDSALATMINLLPLIAVIGLFMFLVGEFLYTRYL